MTGQQSQLTILNLDAREAHTFSLNAPDFKPACGQHIPTGRALVQRTVPEGWSLCPTCFHA